MTGKAEIEPLGPWLRVNRTSKEILSDQWLVPISNLFGLLTILETKTNTLIFLVLALTLAGRREEEKCGYVDIYKLDSPPTNMLR